MAELKTATERPSLAVRSERLNSMLTIRLVAVLDRLRRSGAMAVRREFDLSRLEWQIIAQLGYNDALSLNRLAELLNVDRGQTSRTVKAMVGRGLLDSRRRPNGRTIVITLTDAGDTLHARIVELNAERDRFLLSDLSEEESAALVRLLAKVRVRAELLLDEERAALGREES